MDDNGSVNEDDPEHLCLCLVSSGENISLLIFRVRVLMQRVQLLIEASAGMPSRLAMTFLVRRGLYLGIIIIWTSS